MARHSETMGSDNCGCAIKITSERWNSDEEWELISVEVVKHCNEHEEY